MVNMAASSSGQPPLERDTTDTPPNEYERHKDVSHLRWVWWKAPYFYVVNGRRMNFHDLYCYWRAHRTFPAGVDESVVRRWLLQDKRDATRAYPKNPAFNMSAKSPPATIPAPAGWWLPAADAAGSGVGAASGPPPQGSSVSVKVAGPSSVPAAAGTLGPAPASGSLSHPAPLKPAKLDDVVSATSSQAVPAATPAPVASASVADRVATEAAPAPPAQSVTVSVQTVTSSSSGGAVAGVAPALPAPSVTVPVQTVVSSSSGGAAVAQASAAPSALAQPAINLQVSQQVPSAPQAGGSALQDIGYLVQQLLPTFGVPNGGTWQPPVTGVLGGMTAVNQQSGQPSLVAPAQPSLPAPPVQTLGYMPMDCTPDFVPVAPAAQPCPLVRFTVPTAVGSDPNQTRGWPREQALMERYSRDGYLLYIHQWLRDNLGRFDQSFEQAAPEQALWARRSGIRVHHHFWSHEHIVLYFPEFNEFLELVPEDQMWEDAPRDVSGDVIMGRMCEALWSRCCENCTPWGGPCD